MRIMYARTFSFFVFAFVFTIPKEKEQTRACVSHYEQSAWTAK